MRRVRITPAGVCVSIGFDTRGPDVLPAAVAMAQEHDLGIELTITTSQELHRLGTLALWGVLIPGELMVDEQLAVLSEALAMIPPDVRVTWRLRG